MFGMTEALTCLTQKENCKKPGTCGPPIPGVQAKVCHFAPYTIFTLCKQILKCQKSKFSRCVNTGLPFEGLLFSPS